MPTVPMGGLSLFLNISIILVGGLIKYLQKKGFALRGMRAVFSLVAGREFDNKIRLVVGYAIMLSIFLFLVVTTSVSFAKRMQLETNFDLINSAVNHLNSKEPSVNIRNNNPL